MAPPVTKYVLRDPAELTTSEVNFLVPKLCRNIEKIPFQMKISDLQKWADWPAQAGSKKWAENQETCRFKRNFPISKKTCRIDD